jgi:hypothetical protein
MQFRRQEFVTRIFARAVACGVLGVTVMSVSLAAAPANGKPSPGASLVGGSFSTCFWNYGAVGDDPEYNIAYPDAGATYWAAYYRRPVGSTLELEGTYPYARYMSLISYDRLGQPVDGVADYQMDPIPGSSNPFRPGARRNTPEQQRAYSIGVSSAKNPGFTIRDPRNNEPARDAIYMKPDATKGQIPLGTETGSDGVTYGVELMLYRVYIADRGFDLTGNVALPRPKLTLADGTVLTGQAACDAMDSESKDYKVIKNDPNATRLPDPSALLVDDLRYSALRYPNELTPGQQVSVYPPPGQPGAPLYQVGRAVANPTAFPAIYDPDHGVDARSTEWRAQYNRRYLLQLWTGDDAPGAEAMPQRVGGGFFPNIHNNYIRAVLHRSFGEVAVIRGKLPRAAATRDHRPLMGSEEVRYVSMCMNESVKTTRVMDCVFDEDIPTDANGYYTVVTSRTGERPNNAKQACGVAWIEWSPTGDGFKDPDFGWFQIRNMLPDVNFNHAVQNTQMPGDEITAMGDYLPDVQYMSAREFEALGCHGATSR